MRAPTAAILSVGDELVLGTTLDTNSRTVALALRDAGYDTVEHRTVADSLHAQERALRELATQHNLVVVTGGLGPTDDDLTRDALNLLLDSGAPMVEDPARRAELRQWFEGRGRVMPPINARQALHPRSARTLPNPHGTAPGLAATWQRTQIYCLPGPPSEMVPMLQAHVLPAIRLPDLPPVARVGVLTFGLGESQVAERLGSRMERGREPAVGTTASQSVVTVQVVARTGPSPLQAAMDEARSCEALVQPYAFACAEDTSAPEASLAAALLRAAAAAGVTVAVAESCTAGMLGAAIAAVPGSSAQFVGGWITYANQLKERELGVPAALIQQHGAVSALVAQAMAAGALQRAGAGIAAAVTGVAGPQGGSEAKPVGTVFIGVATPAGARARPFHFPGPRDVVRDRATKAALQLARFALLGVDAPLLWEQRT